MPRGDQGRTPLEWQGLRVLGKDFGGKVVYAGIVASAALTDQLPQAPHLYVTVHRTVDCDDNHAMAWTFLES